MNTTKTLLDSERLALPAKDAAALVGVSRAQWWKLHSAGKVPLPVYLGTKAPRWRVDELRDWLTAGCPDRQTWQRMREARP
jgi:predicted DNA-binding transcriptional regulator AlpA